MSDSILLEKTTALPLKLLKRMLGAAINTSEIDQRLSDLGDDPENLRKQLAHLIKEDNLYFVSEKNIASYNGWVRPELTEFLSQSVPDKNKIIFYFDSNYWGDGWGGDDDTMTVNKTRFFILTIEEGKLVGRILETTNTVQDYNSNSFRMKLKQPRVNYTLYQMIALHPKIIERLVLILGSYEELLKLLN